MTATFRPFSGFIGSKETSTTLVNGANQNVVITSSWVQCTGPSGGFSIGGIAGGVDGQVVVFWNGTGQVLTINNNDAGSTAGNKILTVTGGNVALAGAIFEWCVVQYSKANSAWLLLDHS